MKQYPKNTENNNAAAKPTFFRKKDLLVVGGILLLAGAFFLVWQLTRTPANIARVTAVTPEGEEVQTLSLASNRVVHIADGELPVTLEILDGRIRFVNSTCPDHLCEGFGWLANEGEEAICLPAKVWVRVEQT